MKAHLSIFMTPLKEAIKILIDQQEREKAIAGRGLLPTDAVHLHIPKEE
jgi:hypothetical protein